MWLLRTLLCIGVLLSAALTPPAMSQENFGQGWQNLAPESREEKRQQYFLSLPESKQQRLRENQQKFQAMPGDQKRALCQRFHNQKGYYPPACQSLIGP